MTNSIFRIVDFFFKWIIPLTTYVAAFAYAIVIVGKIRERIGALIWGFLIFAALVLLVVVFDLENYIPSIELKEHQLLVILFLIAGIVIGTLFVYYVEHRLRYSENVFLAAVVALSLITLFLHIYVLQVRITLGIITLGSLIGVFGKKYALGPGSGDGPKWTYKRDDRGDEDG